MMEAEHQELKEPREPDDQPPQPEPEHPMETDNQQETIIFTNST